MWAFWARHTDAEQSEKETEQLKQERNLVDVEITEDEEMEW